MPRAPRRPGPTKGMGLLPTGLVKDMSFVRMRAPDTERALRFLNDFGLTASSRSGGAVYLRCTSPAHHVYVVEQGPPEFAGFAFEAETEQVLYTLADEDGVDARESPEPGGGLRITLTDPDGYRFDVLHGVAPMEPLAMRPPLPLNYAEEKHRINETQRPAVGPAEIKRLGHVRLKVSNLPRSVGWCADRFVLRTTDVLSAGPENHEVAAFLQLDRWSQPVDHHSIVLFESRKPESTTARSRPRTTTRSRPRTTGCATTTGRTRSARADICWAARSSTTGSTLGTEARALRRRRPVHRITRDRAAPHRPIANRPVGAPARSSVAAGARDSARRRPSIARRYRPRNTFIETRNTYPVGSSSSPTRSHRSNTRTNAS